MPLVKMHNWICEPKALAGSLVPVMDQSILQAEDRGMFNRLCKT